LTEFDHQGNPVALRIENQAGTVTGPAAADLGALVLHAALNALHYPIVTIVRALVITITNTAMHIRIQLQDSRNELQLSLLDVTARRFNATIQQLTNDPNWDPQVKQLYLQSLRTCLELEIQRLTARWYA